MIVTLVEIQHGGRRHLGFSSYVNLPHFGLLVIWCLTSVVEIPVTGFDIDALMKVLVL